MYWATTRVKRHTNLGILRSHELVLFLGPEEQLPLFSRRIKRNEKWIFLPARCLPASLSVLAALFEYLCRAWCSYTYIPFLIFKSFSTSAMIYQISKLFIFSSFAFVACGAPTILDAAALMKNGEEAQALNRFFQGLKASDPCTGALL